MWISFPYLTNTHLLQSWHIFSWFLLVNISWVPQFWGEARYFILVTEMYFSPRLLVYSQWGIVVQILRRLIILWSSHLGESFMVSGEERQFYSNKEKATASANSKGLEKEIGEVQILGPIHSNTFTADLRPTSWSRLWLHHKRHIKATLQLCSFQSDFGFEFYHHLLILASDGGLYEHCCWGPRFS